MMGSGFVDTVLIYFHTYIISKELFDKSLMYFQLFFIIGILAITYVIYLYIKNKIAPTGFWDTFVHPTIFHMAPSDTTYHEYRVHNPLTEFIFEISFSIFLYLFILGPIFVPLYILGLISGLFGEIGYFEGELIRAAIPLYLIIIIGGVVFLIGIRFIDKIIFIVIGAFLINIITGIIAFIADSLGLIDFSQFFSSSIFNIIGYYLLSLFLGFILYTKIYSNIAFSNSESGNTAESQTAKELETERLLKQLKSPSYKLKENVAIKLGKSGDSRFVEPLINYLSHPDKDTRIAAIKGLGFLGDRRAVKPIVEVLTHDWSDIARREAASVLGKLQDPGAVEPLLKGFLTADPANWQDYDYYLRALRKMDTLAVPGLIKMLDDPHPARRADTAKLLGEIGDPAAIEPLNKLLLNDGDAQVHMKVATALVLLNSRAHGDAVH
jgi:hypothetical protein